MLLQNNDGTVSGDELLALLKDMFQHQHQVCYVLVVNFTLTFLHQEMTRDVGQF